MRGNWGGGGVLHDLLPKVEDTKPVMLDGNATKEVNAHNEFDS